MLELQRLLDAGHDVTFQHGDGTADGSRSYECCRITPEGNGVNAQLCDILLIAHQRAERAELSQGDAPKPRHLHAKRGGPSSAGDASGRRGVRSTGGILSRLAAERELIMAHAGTSAQTTLPPRAGVHPQSRDRAATRCRPRPDSAT
jgi:hypothetical protein